MYRFDLAVVPIFSLPLYVRILRKPHPAHSQNYETMGPNDNTASQYVSLYVKNLNSGCPTIVLSYFFWQKNGLPYIWSDMENWITEKHTSLPMC